MSANKNPKPNLGSGAKKNQNRVPVIAVIIQSIFVTPSFLIFFIPDIMVKRDRREKEIMVLSAMLRKFHHTGIHSYILRLFTFSAASSERSDPVLAKAVM